MERIHKILSDNWAMRRQEFENLASILLPCIVNGTPEGLAGIIQEKIDAASLISDTQIVREWDLLWDEEIQPGSVLMIPLTGMLYSWRTAGLVEVLKKAARNPNIAGVVLSIDGPGGMTAHVERAARILREMEKPTATVVTDTMASAHFWIGTATDRVFVASPLCELGSVGVVITYVSFREYYKKNGIDYRAIYPDTADLKNKAVRAIDDDNDESLIKERAEKLHLAFSNDVALQLGVAYDPELPLFRGETFNGEEALAMGIADEMGDVEKAVEWIRLQSDIREANRYFSSNR